MPSFFSFVTIKQYLAKERNICIALLITFCYSLGAPLLILGLKELYKTHTFVLHQCLVKSIDLKPRSSNFYPRWNITVLYENQTKDDSLIASTGSITASRAWSVANEYKINETYPCYRAENDISVIQWDWQWNEPSRSKAAAYLFGGVTLLSIGIGIAMLRRRYQEKFKILRQQQTEIPLRNEEQHRTAVTQTTPLPTDDQTVQEPKIIETRI